MSTLQTLNSSHLSYSFAHFVVLRSSYLLSHKEFYKGFKRLDLKGVTHDEVTMLINEVDNNGDGEIDYQETLDHFDDISRAYTHGNRRGSVFGKGKDSGLLDIITKDTMSFNEEIKTNLISTLRCIGVVFIDIGASGRVLSLPFENTTLRSLVWRKYIISVKGEFKIRSNLVDYFIKYQPSLRRCEELPWHLRKTNNLTALKKTIVDLHTLQTMFNNEELKAELFHYLALLSGVGQSPTDSRHQSVQFDIVSGYNRAIERWTQKTNPSSSQIATMTEFIANVMLWFSNKIAKSISVPPFMRGSLDGIKKLDNSSGTCFYSEAFGGRLIHQMHSESHYFFNRWVWIQFPWLALMSASKAVQAVSSLEVRGDNNTSQNKVWAMKKNDPLAERNDNSAADVSVRDKAMISAGVAIPSMTLLKMDKLKSSIDRTKSTADIPYSSSSEKNSRIKSEQPPQEDGEDCGNKSGLNDELRLAYSNLSDMRQVYDRLAVETSVKTTQLQDISSVISERQVGDDRSHRLITDGEDILLKLQCRFNQIKELIAKVDIIEAVHK